MNITKIGLVAAVLGLVASGCGDIKDFPGDDAPGGVSDCGPIVYGVGCPGSGDPHAQSTCMVGDRNDVAGWKQASGCTTTFRLVADPSMTYQTECVAACPGQP